MNSYISRDIRTYTGRINRIFGDRYRWQLITSDSYYQRVIRYIFQNPLRKGLVKKCEDYKYSTLYHQKYGDFFPCKLPGVEFYLTPLGSRVGMQNQGTTVKFSPKLTYYWSIESGISYLVYLTETAKKTDMLFDIGLGGGGHYAINDSWVLKGQLAMTMGTGVNTSSTAMKIFFGLTFYLDD